VATGVVMLTEETAKLSASVTILNDQLSRAYSGNNIDNIPDKSLALPFWLKEHVERICLQLSYNFTFLKDILYLRFQ
jgi:hypothetical protein